MNVCQPVVLPEVGGGGYRVLRLLEAWLRAQGHIVTKVPHESTDVLVCNGWQVPLLTVLRACWLNPSVKVVQRVDGGDYGRQDGAETRQRAVSRLADRRLYQSWASRTRTLAVAEADDPVIPNPVDLAVFTPDGPVMPLPTWTRARVAAVTWSPHPNKGWAEVYQLAKDYPQVQVVLCGRFPEPPALKNLVNMGVVATEALAAILRACDALVTFSRHEACPNHVLEAMACGRPVLYRDSGAMREMVAEGGEPLTAATDLMAALDRVQDTGPRARQRILERHAPDVVFPRYLEAMGPRTPMTRVQRARELTARWVKPWPLEGGL